MSQTNKILVHMRSYGSISQWEAIQYYRITRLSAHIQFLEEAGHCIYSKWKEFDRKRFKVYSLKPFDLF